jgi:ribosomal protein L21
MKTLTNYIQENFKSTKYEVLFLANRNWKEVLAEFIKDCKTNGIPYQQISKQKVRVVKSSKAEMAIKLAKERLGQNNIHVTDVLSVNKGENVTLSISSSDKAIIVTSPTGKAKRIFKVNIYKGKELEIFNKLNVPDNTVELSIDEMTILSKM